MDRAAIQFARAIDESDGAYFECYQNLGSALFHLGRSMAYARPELFLARMFPGEFFRDLLLGICVATSRCDGTSTIC